MKEQKQEPVLDVDVNAALERFRSAVQNEPVPAYWLGAADAADAEAPAVRTAETAGAAQAAVAAAGNGRSDSARKAVRGGGWSSPRFWRRFGSATAAAAVAAVVLFTSWGQGALADVLDSFRVQRLQGVSVSSSELSRFKEALVNGVPGGMEQFDLQKYGQIEQEGGGRSRTVSLAEATRLANAGLKRLPGSNDAQSVHYQPSMRLTFRLHAAPINQLIAAMGGKSKLPASIDGKAWTVTVPAMVEMDNRPAAAADSASPGGKRLIQMTAPSMATPNGVDVEQVRKAVLDLPVLPDSLRAKLAGINDWQHTLPVPMLASDTGKQLTVEGNEAVLSGNDQTRRLLWLQDGRIYQLDGSLADYPTDEAILADAREIMKQ